ncbi:MAG: hypothetical protein J6A07_09410 [Firmicutes bacterium]|nr:hypothetical protein [Bacillota bacterium]
MEWNKSLSVGVPEFDKMLPAVLENVNAHVRMLSASRTAGDYKKHIDAIKSEFIELFTYQESLMVMQKYSQYYQHKHHHEVFLQTIDSIYDQITADYFGTTYAQVDNMITNWLMQHIFMYDKMWGKTVQTGEEPKK